MRYTYKTKGTCSTQIDFDINDDIVTNVSFTRGCNGNLQAVSRLVEGKKASEIASILSGINCNGRGTSCGDQLARAVMEASAVKQA
ncbi:MAG: TIGR03905 family TSCPD domain-containing protein [Eubacterium sp.]|nr:TIGR03905 family TSCPD domain-containing protein [Eubacterium sp.]